MSQAEDPRRVQRKQSTDEVTVEDVRQLMGASTPHFALQLRNRIANLIAGLPPITRRASKASARSRACERARLRRRDARRGRSARASARCPRSSLGARARRPA